MDFVKIQFELPYPRHPEIRRPEDWARMPLYGKEFYQPQLDVVEGLVREIGDDALGDPHALFPLHAGRARRSAPRRLRRISARIRRRPSGGLGSSRKA